MRRLFKKAVVSAVAMLLVLSMATVSFAKTKISEVEMEKVKDTKVIIDLDGQGRVTKQLVNLDKIKKEITIGIEVENLMEKNKDMMPSEIYLVLDNSKSMNEEIPSKNITRREAVFSSAKVLAGKLLAQNPETKVGVISFSTLKTDNIDEEGTLNDAKFVEQATTDLEEIKTAIDGIVADGPRTNIDAGLQTAHNKITTNENVNKVVILLTDGVPNTAVGGPTQQYSGTVKDKTIKALSDLIGDKINVISVMTGVNPDYQPDPDGVLNIEAKGKSYWDLAKEIFGTKESPKFGTFYFVTDTEVEKTIAEDVYEDTVVYLENALKDIVITDVFPQNIVDNFNFKITKSENVGKVDTEINKDTNAITWRIEKLDPQETAYFEYTLSLKEEFEDEIVNIELPTNKELDVDYKDKDGKDKHKDSKESPSVILKKDKAPTPIPQTGDMDYIALVLAIPVGAYLLTYTYKRIKLEK